VCSVECVYEQYPDIKMKETFMLFGYYSRLEVFSCACSRCRGTLTDSSFRVIMLFAKVASARWWVVGAGYIIG
jgi:hypothetical protein